MKFKMICIAASEDGGLDVFVDGMIGTRLCPDEALGTVASVLFSENESMPRYVKTLGQERAWRDRMEMREDEREIEKNRELIRQQQDENKKDERGN